MTAVPRQYVFSQQFTTTGAVPEGWITYDGAARRTGGEITYTATVEFGGVTYERGLIFFNEACAEDWENIIAICPVGAIKKLPQSVSALRYDFTQDDSI